MDENFLSHSVGWRVRRDLFTDGTTVLVQMSDLKNMGEQYRCRRWENITSPDFYRDLKNVYTEISQFAKQSWTTTIEKKFYPNRCRFSSNRCSHCKKNSVVLSSIENGDLALLPATKFSPATGVPDIPKRNGGHITFGKNAFSQHAESTY